MITRFSKYLFSIYPMTVLFNTSTIFCGNFYNSFGIVRNNFIDNIKYDSTMHGKLSSVVESIFEIWGFTCFIAAKSLIYGSMGSVGTYIIYLAFHNIVNTSSNHLAKPVGFLYDNLKL